jgi:hypothetical protein
MLWLIFTAEYQFFQSKTQISANIFRRKYFKMITSIPGLAWVGTLCSSTSYRTAVCEYFNTDMSSAEVSFKGFMRLVPRGLVSL